MTRRSGLLEMTRSRAYRAACALSGREYMQWLVFWNEAREGLWDDLLWWREADA